jgi:nitrile hydratase beta subunit
VNGVHDMGGMHGMGSLDYERDEPVFHARWEGRVYAMVRAMRAWHLWTLDADRHAIETLPPHEYLAKSYYERWLAALEKQLAAHGLASPAEIEAGTPSPGSRRFSPPLTAAMTDRFVNRGLPSAQEPAVRARFQVGDRVRARLMNPTGHTRLPRYARGKSGAIVRDHGVYAFPDTAAHGRGDARQHLYSVRFAACELWGSEAAERDSVHIDMWDDYLEPA